MRNGSQNCLEPAPVRGDVLTRRELAGILGICADSVTRLVEQEGMPCIFVGMKLGGRGSQPRFYFPDVMNWMRRRQRAAAKKSAAAAAKKSAAAASKKEEVAR